jgi:hypothetical protein
MCQHILKPNTTAINPVPVHTHKVLDGCIGPSCHIVFWGWGHHVNEMFGLPSKVSCHLWWKHSSPHIDTWDTAALYAYTGPILIFSTLFAHTSTTFASTPSMHTPPHSNNATLARHLLLHARTQCRCFASIAAARASGATATWAYGPAEDQESAPAAGLRFG